MRAALVIRDCVGELAGGDLQIRVAVNTGEAVVSLGARPALGESMVAGDVVNTAARLQAAAPINGVVVGEETYRETRDAIEYEPAEPVVAKGKEHPRPRVGRAGAADEGGRAAARDLRDRRPGGRAGDPARVLGAGDARAAAAPRLDLRAGRGRQVDAGRRVRARGGGRRGARRAGQVAAVSRERRLRLAGDAADAARAASSRAMRRRWCPRSCGSAPRSCSPGGTGIPRSSPRTSARSSVSTSAPRRTVREALFGSARQFLESAAREQPTILVFEDIHWADANLLDFIETFASRARDLPLLLVTLSRPELLDTRPGWAAGLSAYTALTVPRLGDEHARELAARKLGDAEGLDEVIRVAEGNPLFIEQLAAAIDETESGSLPTSVRALVAARLDALPRAERAVLIDAAVVGKVFWTGASRRSPPSGPISACCSRSSSAAT